MNFKLGSLGAKCLGFDTEQSRRPDWSKETQSARHGAPARHRFSGSTNRMTNAQRLTVVRQTFTQWLAGREGCDADPMATPFAESMLICDGIFRGRRLAANRHYAVWFIEEDELKIHDAETGQLVEHLTGDQIDAANDEGSTRHAA